MFKNWKRTIKKFFREFLVHHHGSLEYRAKVITLIISADGEMCECEKQVLKEMAHKIYADDQERAELLIDTVKEYHDKIINDNGLDFQHLVQLVEKESKSVKGFTNKIDIGLLKTLEKCTDETVEEDVLFQRRLIEFLQNLKTEYGGK